LKVELELAIHDISLSMVVGAYRVVTLCAQLMRDPLAMAKFIIYFLLCCRLYFVVLVYNLIQLLFVFLNSLFSAVDEI